MISKSLYILVEVICFITLVFMTNFPLAFAITHDPTVLPLFFTLSFIAVPLIYGLATFCYGGFFPAFFISTIIGYLIMLISWQLFLNPYLMQLLTHYGLVYYIAGILIPACRNLGLALIKSQILKTLWLHYLVQFSLLSLFLGILLIELGIRKDPVANLPDLLCFLVGLGISHLIWQFITNVFIKKLHVYAKLAAYLKIMGKPIIGFLIGYLTIMMLFAGLYYLCYYFDKSVFNTLANDSFISMTYYSFSIITGLGFSVIEPEKSITFFLTAFENFLGLVWVTVVFAAAVAYLQEPFNKLSKKMEIEYIDK